MQLLSLITILLMIISIVYGFAHPDDDKLIVRTTHGWVEGTTDLSYYGRSYLQFLGIPYAEPPTGNLRFEPPNPALPWTGVYKANKTTECLQINHVPDPAGGVTNGIEDCLYLNVFTPCTNTANLKRLHLPVVAHIHGGGFSFSSGANFHPDFIMDRDLILVTLNYRLGIFGFFSTESVHYPGNMALKDQILALHWIQNNIKRFGGNPKSILLTGLSAGAGSVHYLTMSPQARGLFHKAHSVSGSALRMMQSQPYQKAKEVGEMLGCTQRSEVLLGACLKTIPADKIVETQRVFRPWLYNPFAPFSAIVDKWSSEPVLPKHPLDLLREGSVADIPYLSSFCTAEGLYPAAEYLYKDEYLAELDSRWNELAPVILNLKNIVPDDQLLNISTLVRDKYFGDKRISFATFPDVVKMIGGRWFYSDIEIGVRQHAGVISSPVYSYMFDYLMDMPDFAMSLSRKSYKFGVSHSDDLILYLPTSPPTNGSLTERDEKVMNYLLDIWENFARDGHLQNWTRVSSNFDAPFNYRYINDDLTNEMRTTDELGYRKWWENLKIRQTK